MGQSALIDGMSSVVKVIILFGRVSLIGMLSLHMAISVDLLLLDSSFDDGINFLSLELHDS